MAPRNGSDLAHRIRTPLHGLLSSLDLLLAGDLEPAQRELAETARRAGHELLETLREHLEIGTEQRGGGPGAGDAETFSGHVLLVEDHVVNARLGVRILERLGLEVDLASDGAEAVEKFTKGDFDLVFMDCRMPGMDGFQATATIRGLEAGDRRVPIIALTADASDEDRRRCLDAGMDAHLTKPLVHDALVAMLRRWL